MKKIFIFIFLLINLFHLNIYSENALEVFESCDTYFTSLLNRQATDPEQALTAVSELLDKSTTGDQRFNQDYLTVLDQYLSSLIQRLERKKATVESDLAREIRTYKLTFGFLARIFTKRAKEFKASRIKPEQNYVADLDRAIEELSELRDDLQTHISHVNKNPLLADIRTIYYIAYRDLSSSSSVMLARLLVNTSGDLKPRLDDGFQVFDYFYNADYADLPEDASTILTAAHIRLNLFEKAQLDETLRIYTIFFEEFDAAEAAILTSALLHKRSGETGVKPIIALAQKFYDESKGDWNMSVSLAAAVWLKGGSEEEYAKLLKLYNDAYDNTDMDSTDSGILALAIYLRGSTISIEAADKIVKVIYDNTPEGVGKRQSVVLAISFILNSQNPSELDLSAIGDLFNTCYDIGRCTYADAANLTSTILLGKPLTALDGLDLEVKEQSSPSSSDDGSGANTATILQGYNLATGGGMDGNIATPF